MRFSSIISLLLIAGTGLALTGCGRGEDPEAFTGRRVLFLCDPGVDQAKSDKLMTYVQKLREHDNAITLSIENNPYSDRPDALRVAFNRTPTFAFGKISMTGAPKEASQVGIREGVLHAKFTVNGSSGFMSLRHTVNSSLSLEPIGDGVLKVKGWDVVATHHKTGELRYRDEIAKIKDGPEPYNARCFYPIEG